MGQWLDSDYYLSRERPAEHRLICVRLFGVSYPRLERRLFSSCHQQGLTRETVIGCFYAGRGNSAFPEFTVSQVLSASKNWFSKLTKKKVLGLERQLSSSSLLLPLTQTWAPFPAAQQVVHSHYNSSFHRHPHSCGTHSHKHTQVHITLKITKNKIQSTEVERKLNSRSMTHAAC